MSIVKQFKIGSVVRYASGITALMKIERVDYDVDGEGNHHYYGQQFYGGAMGAYHNTLYGAKPTEIHLWQENEKKEALFQALRIARSAIGDALNNLPEKGDCRALLVNARREIGLAFDQAS
jgi:hypothetical protein